MALLRLSEMANTCDSRYVVRRTKYLVCERKRDEFTLSGFCLGCYSSHSSVLPLQECSITVFVLFVRVLFVQWLLI